MFELFTAHARRVVVWGQEESRLLRHDHIGTEHLLLGLLHDSDGHAGRALARAGVELVAVRQRLEQLRGHGENEQGGSIPFTVRAKQVLQSSLRVSQRLGGDTIGVPHLLRAMLDVPDCTGYQLLVGFEVDIEGLAEVVDELARSGADARTDEDAAVRLVRLSAGTAASALAAPVARRMSAHEISSSVADLAAELAERHDRLAAGLRRYGRHLESCAPASERGCTCGLELLLARIEPPPPSGTESGAG